MNDNMIYLFIFFTAYMIYKQYTQYKVIKLVPQLLADGASIIDVRSGGEFVGGHKEGSINIPLETLKVRMDDFDPTKPIIVCCATGTRSGFAKRAFQAKGFTKVYNAGSWRALTKV